MGIVAPQALDVGHRAARNPSAATSATSAASASRHPNRNRLLYTSNSTPDFTVTCRPIATQTSAGPLPASSCAAHIAQPPAPPSAGFVPARLSMGVYTCMGAKSFMEDYAFAVPLLHCSSQDLEPVFPEPALHRASAPSSTSKPHAPTRPCFTRAACFGVFDGHGGHEVAEALVQSTPTSVQTCVTRIAAEGPQPIGEVLLKQEKLLRSRSQVAMHPLHLSSPSSPSLGREGGPPLWPSPYPSPRDASPTAPYPNPHPHHTGLGAWRQRSSSSNGALSPSQQLSPTAYLRPPHPPPSLSPIPPSPNSHAPAPPLPHLTSSPALMAGIHSHSGPEAAGGQAGGAAQAWESSQHVPGAEPAPVAAGQVPLQASSINQGNGRRLPSPHDAHSLHPSTINFIPPRLLPAAPFPCPLPGVAPQLLPPPPLTPHSPETLLPPGLVLLNPWGAPSPCLPSGPPTASLCCTALQEPHPLPQGQAQALPHGAGSDHLAPLQPAFLSHPHPTASHPDAPQVQEQGQRHDPLAMTDTQDMEQDRIQQGQQQQGQQQQGQQQQGQQQQGHVSLQRASQAPVQGEHAVENPQRQVAKTSCRAAAGCTPACLLPSHRCTSWSCGQVLAAAAPQGLLGNLGPASYSFSSPSAAPSLASSFRQQVQEEQVQDLDGGQQDRLGTPPTCRQQGKQARQVGQGQVATVPYPEGQEVPTTPLQHQQQDQQLPSQVRPCHETCQLPHETHHRHVDGPRVEEPASSLTPDPASPFTANSHPSSQPRHQSGTMDASPHSHLQSLGCSSADATLWVEGSSSLAQSSSSQVDPTPCSSRSQPSASGGLGLPLPPPLALCAAAAVEAPAMPFPRPPALVTNLPPLAPPGRDPGSTALVATIIDGMMYVANVGDCRLVRARRVTRDHTATSHPEEAARLAELKVAVDEEGYHAGVLQVSRSIGDFSTKQALGESVILSTPELHSEALGPDTLFAIACSDGITCAMEDNTMVMLVCQYLNERLASGATNCAQHASRQLVQYAINVKGSDDNASAVVIVFTDLPPPPPLRPKRWRAAPATLSVPECELRRPP
ncbi:hypothetical protein V8C86DRAFT_2717851 [Haematococcus lacustris]